MKLPANSRIIQYPYMHASEYGCHVNMRAVGARLMTVHQLGLQMGGTRRAVYTYAGKKGYGPFENQAVVFATRYLRPVHGPVHVYLGGGSRGNTVIFGDLVTFPDGTFQMEPDVGTWDDFLIPETRLLMAFKVWYVRTQ